jgi:hypothetical protein
MTLKMDIPQMNSLRNLDMGSLRSPLKINVAQDLMKKIRVWTFIGGLKMYKMEIYGKLLGNAFF